MGNLSVWSRLQPLSEKLRSHLVLEVEAQRSKTNPMPKSEEVISEEGEWLLGCAAQRGTWG